VVCALATACNPDGHTTSSTSSTTSTTVSVDTGLSDVMWAACGDNEHNAGLCKVTLRDLRAERVLPDSSRISIVGGGSPLIVSAAPNGPDELWQLEGRELTPLHIGGQAPTEAPDGSLIYWLPGDPNNTIARYNDGRSAPLPYVPPGLIGPAAVLGDGSVVAVTFKDPDLTKPNEITRYFPDGHHRAQSLDVAPGEYCGPIARGKLLALVCLFGPADRTEIYDANRFFDGSADPLGSLTDWRPLTWLDDTRLLVAQRVDPSKAKPSGSTRLAVVAPPNLQPQLVGSVNQLLWSAAPVER
jgi:hypothetical protein